MSIKADADNIAASIVPIDGETADMLDYAESAAAKKKIAQARREIERGEGIAPSPDYFVDLNRRISVRSETDGNSQDRA